MADTQLGYGGYDNDIESFKKAIELVNELEPDFVVFCGDFVDSFTPTSVTDFNDIKSGFNVPCYLTPGNHEMLYQPNPVRLALYRRLFGKDYFSFRHKGYTFIMANSQLWKSPLEGETEKMDAWFKATLKKAKDANSPVFIAQHIPVFLEEPNEPEDPDYNFPVKKRQELLELMVDCGVVAVMGGHKHMNIINNYKGIQLVNTAAVSKNDDGSPIGFQLWKVESPTNITHAFIPLEKTAEE
jgi:3',5'-cyclic AMP phosphodiesterase CpdA